MSDYYEVQRRIKTLEKLLIKKAEPKYFLPILKLIIKGVPFSAITLKNKFLYRSRFNKSGKLFQNIRELKYPPEYSVNNKGRLNDIGESILYASLCELGTIIESRTSLNKLFTITKFENFENKQLLFFPIAVEKPQYVPQPKNKKEQLVYDYLHKEITKIVQDRGEYNSTIAIAHHFMKTHVKWDLGHKNAGFIYPSAVGKEVSNKTTYNVALTPEIFDANYKAAGVTTYFLIDEGENYVLTEVNTASIDSAGNLTWHKNYEEMIDYALSEFGITAM